MFLGPLKRDLIYDTFYCQNGYVYRQVMEKSINELEN